jgi:hypothetical protein
MNVPEIFNRYELDIRRLGASQQDFIELWDDYLEITRCIEKPSPSGRRLNEMQRLKASLEQDIWDVLNSFKN